MIERQAAMGVDNSRTCTSSWTAPLTRRRVWVTGSPAVARRLRVAEKSGDGEDGLRRHQARGSEVDTPHREFKIGGDTAVASEC